MCLIQQLILQKHFVQTIENSVHTNRLVSTALHRFYDILEIEILTFLRA